MNKYVNSRIREEKIIFSVNLPENKIKCTCLCRRDNSDYSSHAHKESLNYL
jgi:hypothetical protein